MSNPLTAEEIDRMLRGLSGDPEGETTGQGMAETVQPEDDAMAEQWEQALRETDTNRKTGSRRILRITPGEQEASRLMMIMYPDAVADVTRRQDDPKPGDLADLDPANWPALMRGKHPRVQALALWTLPLDAAEAVVQGMGYGHAYHLFWLMTRRQPKSILHPGLRSMLERRAMDWTRRDNFFLHSHLPLLRDLGCEEPGRHATLLFFSRLDPAVRRDLQSHILFQTGLPDLAALDETHAPKGCCNRQSEKRAYVSVQLIPEELDKLDWHHCPGGIYYSGSQDWQNGFQIARYLDGFLVRKVEGVRAIGEPWEWTRREEHFGRTGEELWDAMPIGGESDFHMLLHYDAELGSQLLRLWRTRLPCDVPGMYLGMFPDASGEYIEGEYFLERTDAGYTVHWLEIPEEDPIDGSWELPDLDAVERFLAERGARPADVRQRIRRMGIVA